MKPVSLQRFSFPDFKQREEPLPPSLVEEPSEEVEEEAFERGKQAGIQETRERSRQSKEDTIRKLLEKISARLDQQEELRIQYEQQAAKEYVSLLKQALTRLFPLFEDRWGSLETAMFLRDFFKNPPEGTDRFRVTVPQKERTRIEKYFKKTGERPDPRLVWETAEPGQDAVQICWEEGGVTYARTQLFEEILSALESYAQEQKGGKAPKEENDGE
ncbi:MAG: hypothetical protein LBJ70_04885 [Holosporales bacterium]|jgi:hypothetical protein|nr:hypothetical protein [Holosporales bacterium]